MYPRTRSRWCRLTRGPIRVSGSNGSPTGRAAAAEATASTTSSYRLAGARIRVWAAQAWELLTNDAYRRPLASCPRSASSRTTAADFPPSSRLTRRNECPHSAAIRRPAAVDPVKATLSTPGWATSASPVATPPVRMDTTPSGSPAASITSARTTASNDASGAALTTTVQPASRAGASLVAMRTWGTFQATTAATTPTGSRRSR